MSRLTFFFRCRSWRFSPSRLPPAIVEFGGLLAIAAALLCIALVVMARAVGSQLTLALHLSLENKQLAEDLAERGIALERANRQLSVEALTDPLTGMANRRQLMNFMRTNAAARHF